MLDQHPRVRRFRPVSAQVASRSSKDFDLDTEQHLSEINSALAKPNTGASRLTCALRFTIPIKYPMPQYGTSVPAIS